VAQALILDSEAINGLANPDARGVSALRTRAILQAARESSGIVRVPAPVLAEVCRNARLDAAINHVLSSKGIVVAPLTPEVARRAGHLLAKAKLSSAHAVDAFVVSTALEYSDALIATGDLGDMQKLSAGHKQIRIFAL
jgi:hypothetical protein